MYELSLNIMDIAQNSIRAGAALVEVGVWAGEAEDLMRVSVADDGCGMSERTREAALDPFYTTRTTRSVGLGLPYFQMVAEMCGGRMDVWSKEGEGTKVEATFRLSHIDRAPLGDMGQTMALLAGANPGTDFVYRLEVSGRGSYVFDTREVKELLDGVPINTPDVVVYMEGMINENSQNVTGGITL
jgi:hypothetical protein